MGEKCIMPQNPLYATERLSGYHRHEVFFGTANRQLSIDDGLVVFLPPHLHNMSSKGVHQNRELDLHFKRIGQKAWMDYYGKSEEEFRQRYGKSYL